MHKLSVFFSLVSAFAVGGVALSYGIYDSTHPLQVFESDIIHCNDVNMTLDDTKTEPVIASCTEYLISAVEYAMTRNRNYIKNHCYEYNNRGGCSKAFKTMTLEELREKLDSKKVF